MRQPWGNLFTRHRDDHHAPVPPLPAWPDAADQADYLGAAAVTEHGVATRWRTTTGILAVVWPTSPGRQRFDLYDAATAFADTTVVVRPDFGIYGPGLEWWGPSRTSGRDHHETDWPQLTRVLGRPAPYWPSPLRTEALISTWQLGGPQITSPVTCEPDIAPLLRLAATVDETTPMARTLRQLAQLLQHRATEAARRALADFDDLDPATFVLPAAPAPVDEPDLEELDTATRRAGWLDVLSRADPVSRSCVHTALAWDGGSDFPYSNPDLVDPAAAPAPEWIRRLQPAPPPVTALYQSLDPDGTGEPLVDPLTDAPAVRHRQRTGEELTVAVPQRLPATNPLAELILGEDHATIWVRTTDGTLWPAPKNEYFGLSWGYSGSGPGTLALLIARLLDDITARGADGINGAPAGLEQLTETDWPAGTVFTRAHLEAARNGTPPTMP